MVLFSTKVGKRHPHLSFDLLGEQIAACREFGVRGQIYITVGWLATDAENHPQWVIFEKDRIQDWFHQPVDGQADTPRRIVSWKNLCIATGYRQHVLDLTREVCERYAKVDGIFFDICSGRSVWRR